MQREVIRPLVDQPVVVKLDQADGIQREGKYGIDFQYTVNDDAGVMWLPAQAREALLRTNAQAGDLVEIVKTRRGKDYLYSVRHVSDANEPPAERRQAIPPRAYFQPGMSAAEFKTNLKTASSPAPANGNNGNGHYANGSGQAAPNGHAGRLAMCLRAAIDAIAEATTYAGSKGLTLQFNEEDVRCCGLTLFIQEGKR